MPQTIDKAGRVVIPAQIRERLDLVPGTPLKIAVEDNAVEDNAVVLRRDASGPKLERKGNRVIVRPASRSASPSIDIASVIEEERNRWPG